MLRAASSTLLDSTPSSPAAKRGRRLMRRPSPTRANEPRAGPAPAAAAHPPVCAGREALQVTHAAFEGLVEPGAAQRHCLPGLTPSAADLQRVGLAARATPSTHAGVRR